MHIKHGQKVIQKLSKTYPQIFNSNTQFQQPSFSSPSWYPTGPAFQPSNQYGYFPKPRQPRPKYCKPNPQIIIQIHGQANQLAFNFGH